MAFKPDPVQPDFADLIVSLTNSKVQTTNYSLYQTIYLLLQRITKSRDLIIKDIKDLEESLLKIGNVSFLTQDDETTTFPNARRLLASLGLFFDDSMVGERTIRLTHYWNVLTDGANPAVLITASGDAIACQVPNDDVAPFFPMGI